jgi:hypothetical protein
MTLSNNIGQSYIQGRKAMLGLWKGPANGNDDYRHGTDVNSDTTASDCHKWKEGTHQARVPLSSNKFDRKETTLKSGWIVYTLSR